MVNIYKFCKKGILIQPPGEPREQHPPPHQDLGKSKDSKTVRRRKEGMLSKFATLAEIKKGLILFMGVGE